jgi:hypothetical protein
MTEATYHLLGKACTRDEYVAFKKKLRISERFVDERHPAVRDGGKGGFGAIWDAVDPVSGKTYTVNESLIDGASSHRIEEA